MYFPDLIMANDYRFKYINRYVFFKLSAQL